MRRNRGVPVFLLSIFAIIFLSILWLIDPVSDLYILILSNVLAIVWLYMTKESLNRKVDFIIFIIANFILLAVSIASLIKDVELQSKLKTSTIDEQAFQNNQFLSWVMLAIIIFSFSIIIFNRKDNQEQNREL